MAWLYRLAVVLSIVTACFCSHGVDDDDDDDGPLHCTGYGSNRCELCEGKHHNI